MFWMFLCRKLLFYCLSFCLPGDGVNKPPEVCDLKVFRFPSIYSISLLRENLFCPLYICIKKLSYMLFVYKKCFQLKKMLDQGKFQTKWIQVDSCKTSSATKLLWALWSHMYFYHFIIVKKPHCFKSKLSTYLKICFQYLQWRTSRVCILVSDEVTKHRP